MTNQELGEYLKNIRENIGYSIYDVNKLCDISPSYVSLMENGKRKPSPIILKKLANTYFLDYNDLLKKANYEELINFDTNIEGMDKKPEGSAIVLVYGTIPARYSYGMYRRYY